MPEYPDPSRHADKRNILETVLRYIPGFRGYLEKEYRRESDYLARQWLADRLQASKSRLNDYLQELVDSAQLDALPLCERFRSRMDRVINRMRGEVRGYSGIFDFVRVREELLDEVYELDHALMQEVDQLADVIEALSGEDGSEQIRSLMDQLDGVERKFDQRGDLLKGIAGEPS